MEVRKPDKEIRINNSGSLTHHRPSPSTLDLSHLKDPDPTRPSPSPAQTSTPTPEMARYAECRRNHAAHLGAHVVDGCGEFMPAGEEGTPLALKCAACDCHRNFHRREIDPPHLPPPLPPTTANCYISFSKLQKNHPRAPMMMAFGGAAESSSEDLNAYRAGQMETKKRFRTKFSEEQKEKMMEFAEKLGWRIQRQDEGEVQRFCHQVGVKRQVFKVWMHNNKQASKRKHP